MAPTAASGRGSEISFRMLFEQKLAPPVLFPGGLIMARSHRAIFAVADGVNQRGINAEADKLLAQSQGTTFTQGAIVLFGAPFIAMSVHLQGVPRVAFQLLRDGGNFGFLGTFHRRAIEIEADGISLKDLGVSGPVLAHAGIGQRKRIGFTWHRRLQRNSVCDVRDVRSSAWRNI